MFLCDLIIQIERSRRKMYRSNDPAKTLKISQELDKLLIQYYSLKEGAFGIDDK